MTSDHETPLDLTTTTTTRMDEESLFAFQPPPHHYPDGRFAHLTQPTQLLQEPHAASAAQWETYPRPMTAPSFSSTAQDYAYRPSPMVPYVPATTQLQPFILPDEPTSFKQQQQRPATSTGHSLQQQTTFYPAFAMGLHPDQFQALPPASHINQRRVSSAYPFSHDPFPDTSASRPTTANARMISSRPGTANTIRPDTASSTSSTILEGATTAVGPDGRLYQFVGLQPTHKKRARRRFDEIERMYSCNYTGCTKAYGCLNHLNAHVAAQKHGPKRLPTEFKEMRKEWRAKKKAEEAARKKAVDEHEDGLAQVEGEHTQQDEDEEEEDSPTGTESFLTEPNSPTNGLHHPPASASAIFQYAPPPFPSYPSHDQIEAMRPQTAPGGIDMFSFHPPSPTHQASPPSPDRISSSPFKFHSEDPALGLMGLPKRRGSIPTSSLDGIPEFQATAFAYQQPHAHLPLHHSLPNSHLPSFGHHHNDWMSQGSPVYSHHHPSRPHTLTGVTM